MKRTILIAGLLAVAGCTHPEVRPTREPAAFRAMLGDWQEVIAEGDCRDVTLPGFIAREVCQ